MINNLLDIFSKTQGNFFTDKIDKKDLYQIINWDKVNNIFETSYFDFNSFLILENDYNEAKSYIHLIDYLFEEKNIILKKLNLFDINLLNLSFELSKNIKAYIDMSLEIDNSNSFKEINIKNSQVVLFQVYGNSDIEIFDENNNLYFKSSLIEGDLIYLPNSYKISKKSNDMSMYLYLYIFPLSNILYMEWLSRNILFDNNFIIKPLFIKENLNNFIDSFKKEILGIIDDTNNDYLKKQINVINNLKEITFPDIFSD